MGRQIVIETNIPDHIRHGKSGAVIDLFKIIVSTLLRGENKFLINAGIVAGTNTVTINCYCESKDVGMLLGKQELGITTPTKWAIVRILKIVGYWAGVDDVMVRIEDFSKIPSPEGKDERQKAPQIPRN